MLVDLTKVLFFISGKTEIYDPYGQSWVQFINGVIKADLR